MNLNYYDIIIIILILLILYPFAIYPVILFFLSKLFKNEAKRKVGLRKKISIIISCYNEENLIEDCIKSIFQSDYPLEDIEVIVGSDGSTDRTTEIVRGLANQYSQIKLFELTRSGKNKVLNELCKKATGEILFFLDADVRLSKDTISLMIENYEDKNVGAVLAYVMNINTEEDINAGHLTEDFYQRFEKYIRKKESIIFSTFNAMGQFYSVSKSLYEPIPNEFVCDDFTPILNVALKRKRNIFEDRAIVYEVRKKSLSGEFARRVRMASCGMSSVWNARKLFSFKTPLAALFLFSHKVSRWFATPLFILILALSIAFYSISIVALFSLFLILLTVLIIIIGWICEKNNFNCIIFRFAYIFYNLNIGMLCGFFKFILRKENSKWESIK